MCLWSIVINLINKHITISSQLSRLLINSIILLNLLDISSKTDQLFEIIRDIEVE